MQVYEGVFWLKLSGHEPTVLLFRVSLLGSFTYRI